MAFQHNKSQDIPPHPSKKGGMGIPPFEIYSNQFSMAMGLENPQESPGQQMGGLGMSFRVLLGICRTKLWSGYGFDTSCLKQLGKKKK